MELLELRTLWRWLALGALAVTLLGGAVERALARTAGDRRRAASMQAKGAALDLDAQ